jgi:hypothetical protein
MQHLIQAPVCCGAFAVSLHNHSLWVGMPVLGLRISVPWFSNTTNHEWDLAKRVNATGLCHLLQALNSRLLERWSSSYIRMPKRRAIHYWIEPGQLSNDLREAATVEKCRRIIDTTLRGDVAAKSDIDVIFRLFSNKRALSGWLEAA